MLPFRVLQGVQVATAMKKVMLRVAPKDVALGAVVVAAVAAVAAAVVVVFVKWWH